MSAGRLLAPKVLLDAGPGQGSAARRVRNLYGMHEDGLGDFEEL